jgi:putative ABC transport system permease protein
MTTLREWMARLRGTVRPARRDADLEEELRLHVELALEHDRRNGSVEGAGPTAMRLGGITQAMDALRDQRGLPWLDDLGRDLRYGLRALRRDPVFASVAILTLALAIGANTAIFSVVEAVVLRTLPIEASDQVYFIGNGSPDRPGLGSNYPYFERVAALTDVFAGVTAYTRAAFKVSTGDAIEITQGQFVSGNYHAVLGVPIRLGRGFTSVDDRAGADALIAVISDSYWARMFGRSPDVLGQTITVGGRPMAIVGVTATGFDGLDPGTRLDLTLPLAVKTLDAPGFLTVHDMWTSMPIVARLRPGVTDRQAASAVDAVFQQYFSEPENAWLRDGPRGDQFRTPLLLRADRGAEGLRDDYSIPLQVLMAMVGVVLLIACVNVANLLMARGTVRAKEVAVRISIGASRRRLIRQFLTESALLALIGGALGFVLAWFGADTIVALVRVGPNPVLLDVRPNATVMGFTIAISLLTGIFFGLIPALGTTRVELTPALKEVGAAVRSPHRRWSARQVLVAAQIGLCLALLSGAALLTRTLRNLETYDGGFARENVLMFSLDARDTPFPSAQMPALCRDLIERLTSRADVSAGSCSTSVPINSRGNARPLDVPGTSLPQDVDARLVFMNRVTPGYFRTLGIRAAEGRDFDAHDTAASGGVAVVNRGLVRFFFGSANPIGRRIQFFKDEGATR